MTVALLTLELMVPDAQTLKAKRSALRPLLEGLRRSWNVSAAETGHQDTWQRATVSVATVNTEAGEARRTLDLIVRHVEERPDLQVLDSSVEIL